MFNANNTIIDTSIKYSEMLYDRKVPGYNLKLTHQVDNSIPDSFYTNTSAKVMLNFTKFLIDDKDRKHSNFDSTFILSNYFDIDSVSLAQEHLNPKKALTCSSSLIKEAKAGDF